MPFFYYFINFKNYLVNHQNYTIDKKNILIFWVPKNLLFVFFSFNFKIKHNLVFLENNNLEPFFLL